MFFLWLSFLRANRFFFFFFLKDQLFISILWVTNKKKISFISFQSIWEQPQKKCIVYLVMTSRNCGGVAAQTKTTQFIIIAFCQNKVARLLHNFFVFSSDGKWWSVLPIRLFWTDGNCTVLHGTTLYCLLFCTVQAFHGRQ